MNEGVLQPERAGRYNDRSVRLGRKVVKLNTLPKPVLTKQGRLAVCVAVVFLSIASASFGQQTKGPSAAPVPPQVCTAKKVFISNAGGESFENVIEQTVFDGGPDRPYNQFYAAMKEWGRYEMASTPADSDLVFEVSWALTDVALKLPVLGQLRVVVIDPKTHVTLWNLTQYVRGAVLLSNRDKNFDQAMTTVMNRLKTLATAPSADASSSQK